MNRPTTLDLMRNMPFDEYVDFVTFVFVDQFGRKPNGDMKARLRFWYDINVHPVSAAKMLPAWGC